MINTAFMGRLLSAALAKSPIGMLRERMEEDRTAEILRATRSGHTAAMMILLDDDPCLLLARDQQGATPLHIAAANDQCEACGVLMAYGADVDCRDACGATPLHYATIGGFEEVVSMLLDWGADPCAATDQGVTPLIASLAYGHESVQKRLKAARQKSGCPAPAGAGAERAKKEESQWTA